MNGVQIPIEDTATTIKMSKRRFQQMRTAGVDVHVRNHIVLSDDLIQQSVRDWAAMMICGRDDQIVVKCRDQPKFHDCWRADTRAEEFWALQLEKDALLVWIGKEHFRDCSCSVCLC